MQKKHLVLAPSIRKEFNTVFYFRAFEYLLSVVVMPRLPRNAKVEWHAIAAVDKKLSNVQCKLEIIIVRT